MFFRWPQSQHPLYVAAIKLDLSLCCTNLNRISSDLRVY